ncbi:fungal specific transcription factor domain containing protein [Ophiostoma piceae UAMH 11346]|uniref:Fungal specific transcription factor domain containing protein n=1 Tax=Ophiostoma piceae (strain UAMH 11346) TaxID=1262450 RepID=S3C6D3_OPHP1|nr:fungal specific transcription factor domain containing protein [Ophiostoma piceae UAMH 11346]
MPPDRSYTVQATGTPRSLRRSTKVCLRCRKRKTKCDFKFPACTSCKLAKAECVGFDPATREAAPRSLVKSLEARVAELEAQTLAFRAAPQNVPNSMASIVGRATIAVGIPSSLSYLQSKISSRLIFQPSCPPLAIVRDRSAAHAPVGQSRGITGALATTNTTATTTTAITTDINTESTTSTNDRIAGQRPKHASSASTRRKFSAGSTVIDLDNVPFSAIERIVENYANTHLPQYPCITRVALDDIVARTRVGRTMAEAGGVNRDEGMSPTTDPGHGTDMMPLDHHESFVLFIVLAISTMTLTWKDDNQARRASESFYNSALKHLQQVVDGNEMRALQASLLLAHYAHMCPERVDNWTCIANAVRIVLNLGLYQKSGGGEPGTGSRPMLLSPERMRQRTELFWVTYGMERSLCTILRLPLSFPEDIITADVPCGHGTSTVGDAGATDDERLRRSAADHIRQYRQLETEVHRMLHLEEDLERFVAADGRVGFVSTDAWVVHITGRLRTWYSAAQRFSQYNMLEFQHIQFHHLRARIHRPTPRLKQRTPADRRIVLDAARVLIEDYLGQERRCRLFYPWHGVHILFETALLALDACWALATRDDWPLPSLLHPTRGLHSSRSRDHDHNHQSEALVRPMLETYIPQCLDVILNIGTRWNEATACADRLAPLVTRVRAALSSRGSGDLYTDMSAASITEEIQGLLFSERPLIWNHNHHKQGVYPHPSGVLPGGTGASLDGSSSGDLLRDSGVGDSSEDLSLVDELGMLQWDPDWSLLPTVDTDQEAGLPPMADAAILQLDAEEASIAALLSLSGVLDSRT